MVVEVSKFPSLEGEIWKLGQEELLLNRQIFIGIVY